MTGDGGSGTGDGGPGTELHITVVRGAAVNLVQLLSVMRLAISTTAPCHHD